MRHIHRWIVCTEKYFSFFSRSLCTHYEFCCCGCGCGCGDDFRCRNAVHVLLSAGHNIWTYDRSRLRKLTMKRRKTKKTTFTHFTPAVRGVPVYVFPLHLGIHVLPSSLSMLSRYERGASSIKSIAENSALALVYLLRVYIRWFAHSRTRTHRIQYTVGPHLVYIKAKCMCIHCRLWSQHEQIERNEANASGNVW